MVVVGFDCVAYVSQSCRRSRARATSRSVSACAEGPVGCREQAEECLEHAEVQRAVERVVKKIHSLNHKPTIVKTTLDKKKEEETTTCKALSQS